MDLTSSCHIEITLQSERYKPSPQNKNFFTFSTLVCLLKHGLDTQKPILTRIELIEYSDSRFE